MGRAIVLHTPWHMFPSDVALSYTSPTLAQKREKKLFNIKKKYNVFGTKPPASSHAGQAEKGQKDLCSDVILGLTASIQSNHG